jgi:hypothetical protein
MSLSLPDEGELRSIDDVRSSAKAFFLDCWKIMGNAGLPTERQIEVTVGRITKHILDVRPDIKRERKS